MQSSNLMTRMKLSIHRLPLSIIRNHPKYHWFVVATVCIGAFMAALDASIINVTLPTLKRHFHIELHQVEWVSLVYLLSLTGLIVPLGRAADILGRRWMYALGFGVFLIGSLLCGLATSLLYLLIFRVVQAVGAAMLQANSVSLITGATPIRDRGKAIGLQASAQGIGLSVGPAIGGAILSVLGWKWIFFVNVPVGIVGTLLAVVVLPADELRNRREAFDFRGSLYLVPAVVSFIYVLNQAVALGPTSPIILLSTFVFALSMVGFIRAERRTRCPMIDFKLFTAPGFFDGIITGVLSFAVMYGVLLLVPFYLDGVRHSGTLFVGVVLALVPIGMSIVTPFSGALSDQRGHRVPMQIGMLSAFFGCVSLMFITPHGSLVPLVVGISLVGIGMGMFTPANNARVMSTVKKQRLGVAGSVLNMGRSLGMGLGITLGGMCYQLFSSIRDSQGRPHTAWVHDAFAFDGSFAVMALVAAIALQISRKRERVVS